MSEIIAQGAEAVIRKDGSSIVKDRVSKGYRIREIDNALRRKRTRLEARLLREARRAGVMTPQVSEEDDFSIKMGFVDGNRVKESVSAVNFKIISEKIGTAVASLHNYNIIHGDLTTSNMILKQGELYFIDFGLGFTSARSEDKATDLHVLREAIEATHFSIAEKFWLSVMNAYRKNYEGSDKVIKALSKIEKRGRYSRKKGNQEYSGVN